MPIPTAIHPLAPLNQAIEASEFYETAISVDETVVSNYWYLGISYLLAGREEDAQAAWFVPFSSASEAETDTYTKELLAILDREAKARSEASDLEDAWLLRQHLRIIDLENIENILQLVILADSLDRLNAALLIEWQIDELLSSASLTSGLPSLRDATRTAIGDIDDDLLERAIAIILQKIRTDFGLKLINSCLQLTTDSRSVIISKIVKVAFQLFYQQANIAEFSIRITEMCQSLLPTNLEICHILSCLYSGIDLHSQAMINAEYYYQHTSSFNKLFGSYLVQRAFLTAGNWNNYVERIDEHHQLLSDTILNVSGEAQECQIQTLIASSFFNPYLEDSPKVNRSLQNKVAAIYQNNLIPAIFKSELEELSLKKEIGVLRIGYLASTLREHSVGWLSRWLFHHHDRQSFQVFIYCVNQTPNDTFNHKWFRDKVDVSYYFDDNLREVIAQIKEDEIDILIDLDSLTFDLSCVVMSYKPAPVQATWLGWDASGIPAIDYFIADPYVLPDDAQDYYQEKIIRLPQTYLAVDGFEVGIPSLNRQDLNIPNDAVIYFSSQSGYKRHPDNIRCQMRIIKVVPDSYLLIKGKSDPQMIRDLFGKIAEEEGVSLDRLRFLGSAPDEATHRANLAIADIVLDTFPYNGATTTLETLWMGIPMVTQVGQQFAARNSYTFMLNAGIEEGIAWSEEEYIEWGIKLGLDRDLRDKIAGKLRSGRTTAPVWNAKQFTLDLEQIYREMWAKYQAQQDSNETDLHDLN
jgi:predicted O-linked N-acetylglucosamine transferase (SPINDLY family)